MVRRSAFALTLSLAVAACTQPAPLEVTDAWTRATVANTPNAAVYMTITSPTPDRLVAASAPVAKKTDLMTMEARDGTMGMQYLAAIDIPADKPVRLNSAGLHIWLAGLNQPLTVDQSFPLTLSFEQAGERTVMVSVKAPGAPAPVDGMRM